jgi:hypothetical protein
MLTTSAQKSAPILSDFTLPYTLWPSRKTLSPLGLFKIQHLNLPGIIAIDTWHTILSLHDMTKVTTIISITTGMLLIYIITASVSGNFVLVFLLFLITSALFFYMVICILKDAPPPTRTFDEYFYDDADIKNS